MNTRRSFRLPLLLSAVVLAIAFGFYFQRPGHTPPGQRQLLALTADNFASLSQDFNHDVRETRVLLLLSPT